MLLALLFGSIGLLGGSTAAGTKRQAQTCTGALLIDDFSRWDSGENSLAGATSDDGTMNSTSLEGGVLTFTPTENVDSYLYEQFPCTDAVSQGYSALSFDIKGPEAASVSLEMQYQDVCDSSSEEHNSTYYTVNGLDGVMQTVTIPLSSWTDGNANAIVGFLWYGFSKGFTGTDSIWQLTNVRLLCENVGTVPSTTPVPAPTTTALPSPPVTVTVTVTQLGPPAKPPTTTRRTTTRRPRPTPPCRFPWWDCDDDGWLDQSQPTTIPAVEEQQTEAKALGVMTPRDECDTLLVDDWESQSRLTFLYYNAMLRPSSDDGTMKSIKVQDNTVVLTPKNTDSYFYTQLGCMDARPYGGISLRISAPSGTQFDVQLASTKGKCGGDDMVSGTLSTKQLGWTFNGREQLYSIPFSKYSGIDWTKFNMLFIANLKKAVTLSPVALYCGNKVVEYIAPAPMEPAEPTETVAAPPSKATNLIVDQFRNADQNALGEWHGGDEGLALTFRDNKMTLQTNDADLMWNTQVSGTCRDMRAYQDAYLHIAYSGSNKFSVALQQHNEKCDEEIAPFPETWDSLEAARYSSESDIYMPMGHFHVDFTRIIGFALKGFYSGESTTFAKLEIVNQVPRGWTVPEKLPSGEFVFACKRPNSFAFAIDDGDPAFAAQVMDTIRDEDITVTFFTVGAPLMDPASNLSSLYSEMAGRGHQIAMHSYTHPALEGLADEAAIDWEYSNMIRATAQSFNGLHTPYFRAPFGTEGARMRQRLAAVIDDPYIVQWSVDVEDWLWAESETPEKQLEAFKRDVAKGGNLVVMHYLYPSTVGYLKQFIQIAKATGKQLMRVDQCMMDPNAPPL